ncbi:MAG: hypothetical protein DHS20C15_07250 [Planctomycetota bacterium]|nr:MAG: hypothetical protein DHS20C15_07250 [Planctomycetota bacterium]
MVVAPVIGLIGPVSRWSLSRGALFPALPLVWVTLEALRMHWPDVGFSWLLVGHAWAAHPLTVQVADLGGVLAVSFVGACASTALLAWRMRRRGALPAVLVVATALLYGVWRPSTLPEPEAGPLIVSIQPGFPQELKEQQDMTAHRWQVCRQLALRAAAEHPQADLLVFPETMWPGGVFEDDRRGDPGPAFALPTTPARDALDDTLQQLSRQEAARLGELLAAFDGSTWALIGTTLNGVLDLRNPPVRMQNSVLLFDSAGTERDRYSKHILIPGGEKLPLVDMVPSFVGEWIEQLVYSIAHFAPNLVPGPGPSVMRRGEHDFGVTICFENAYGDYTRRFVQAGARYLVNLSNEGWFDTSAEFDHMQLQSVLRCVETRRAMFRSTNTGISSLVRPMGRMPREADVLQVNGQDRAVAGVFSARVPLYSGSTLYTSIGDAWAWLAALFVLARCFFVARMARLP